MATGASVSQQEITAALQALRERVAARYPTGRRHDIDLPDLLPLLQARDSAEGKAASIGMVNPRGPGLLNNAIQSVKRTLSRSLHWFVRDQIDFNQRMIACVQATLESLNDVNRSLDQLGARLEQFQTEGESVADLRTKWTDWHQQWERTFTTTEIRLLRAMAELQQGHEHKTQRLEDNLRGVSKAQQDRHEVLVKQAMAEVEQRFWGELRQVRLEYERVIHEELRLVRQRAAGNVGAFQAAAEPSSQPDKLPFDYTRFAARFRGPEEYVKANLRQYVDRFQGCRRVLDVGCGRGEFLECLREQGIAGQGIDLDAESVALCRSKGLQAEQADLFQHLAQAPAEAYDGIFFGQVVEHLPPMLLPEAVRLASQRLVRGGVLAFETPNPECLAIFATHFYLDPTHQRPVPPQLLAFYCEEFGLGGIEVIRLAPAEDSLPALRELPEGVRSQLFGALDYALIARKL